MLIAALVTSCLVHPFLSYWKGLKVVGGGGEGPPTSWPSVFGVLLRAVPLHKPPVSALFPHFSMCPTSSEGWSDSCDLAEGKLTVHSPPLLMKASRLPMAPAEKAVPVGLWFSSGSLWGSGGGVPRTLVWTDNQREGTLSVSDSYPTQHACSRNLCIYFSDFPTLTSQVNEFVPARVREISLQRSASWGKFLWS